MFLDFLQKTLPPWPPISTNPNNFSKLDFMSLIVIEDQIISLNPNGLNYDLQIRTKEKLNQFCNYAIIIFATNDYFINIHSKIFFIHDHVHMSH